MKTRSPSQWQIACVLVLLTVAPVCSQTNTTIENFTPIAAARLVNGLGWNVTLGNEWEFEKVRAAGGKEARFQFSWDAVEATDGTLRLSPKFQDALAWCAKYGLEPMIVAAYAGPRAKLTDITVAHDLPAGSKELPVTGSLDSIKPPFCHVLKSDRGQIVAERKWAYYGALIDSVDISAGTITLAAKTTVALTAGTKLTVNQLRYASVATANEDDPSLLAYVRYVRFLADEIAARKLKGKVEIWNEPPWAHDPWDHREGFYDEVPKDITSLSPNWGLLRALLKDTPPAGVRYTWGGSHKSGTRGVLFLPPPAPTQAQIAASIPTEGWHPYGPSPEWNGWNPELLPTAANVFKTGLEGTNAGSNFKQGRRKSYDHLQQFGWTVTQQVSEAGIETSDQLAKARWVVRFFLANMAMGPEPLLDRVNFYRLAEKSDGYAMIDASTHLELPAYVALKSLISEAAAMSVPPAPFEADDLPTITGPYAGAFPLTIIPIVGRTEASELRNRMLFVCYQRTYDPTDKGWLALAPPAVPVTVTIPAGLVAQSARDLVTLHDVGFTATGSSVTFDVAANPVALEIAPAVR